MWKPAAALRVSREDREWLETLARSGKTPQRVALRARMVLGAAEGRPNHALAKELGISRSTLLLWRQRYAEAGVAGLLKDAARPGRKKRIRPEKVEAIVNATLQTTPPDATHWSVRTLAKRQRVSPATVHRIWQAHNLQPHRVETFKLSRDPEFVRKLRDIVGLYLHPPAKALVLSVDEKSQIQALDRTQPILPLRPGIPARQTHDYERHGTTTLFAALNILEGHVIERCQTRHTHTEFIAFLGHDRSADAAAPDHPSHSRQLRHAQASHGEDVARGPPTVSFPLHPDRGFLAESRRAFLRRDHAQAPAPGHVPQRAGADRRHSQLCPRTQQRPPSLHLDGHRLGDLPQDQTL